MNISLSSGIIFLYNYQTQTHETTVVTEQVATVFLSLFTKGISTMSNRTRKHPVQFYLNDDEQYILDEKFRLSKMKNKSAFLRKMILYGFVYDVDYSHIREMNTLLGNISGNLNQITKRINTTNSVYKKEMEDITELMDQIWQLQKSMVSKQPLIKQ